MCTTKVYLVEHQVEVPSGGLYDQYRMNPDLEKIKQIPEITCKDFSFFQENPKKEVTTKIGPTWSPNYYYKMKSVQFVMLAPIKECRAKVAQKFVPLSPISDYGLVAITFYSYDVCDKDSYNEVSVAVICRQPGSTGPHILEIIRSILSKWFYSYVIALPVTTEIARVRGKFGYDLPEWLMKIDLDIGNKEITLMVSDMDGRNDLSIKAPAPSRSKPIP
ncbi:uncharacterized protein FA14DRAFT_184292 [Meira miltonrushii]|uniref:Uncharacterized protein n=1 Tax=Meira miltonrushii TaxID=1280837 RepID=A0A316VC79_9BASI|nr:uncharacterized protein FA14DRAFT_184292 [Meira miltonrushii]PWN34904.1 hypothetical protein FA14DRAFT_184292 [Meira miltonrushii]